MWKVGLAVATGIMASVFAGQAFAITCTGGTTTVASGGSVSAASLVGTGACVNAGDKTFGNFSDSGFSNTGSVTWTFASLMSNVVIGFQGALTGPTTGTLDFEVAINPAITTTMAIENVEKDFTLNATDGSGFATGTLTGTSTPLTAPPIAISCVRNVNPTTGTTCPQTNVFAPVSDLTLHEVLTLGTNATATALTDTISQTAITTPEPATLALLGSGLLGLAAIRRRRR